MTRNPWKEALYSVHVFEDYAIIQGAITSDVLTMLIRLCKKEGFTHMVPFDGGFKLIRTPEAAKMQARWRET